MDNFFIGRKRNVEYWIGYENFELMNYDIVNSLFIEGKDWVIVLLLLLFLKIVY